MSECPKFGIGHFVFAKIRGYSPWPAKVEGIEDGPPSKRTYSVYFYGTKQIGNCKEKDLCSYIENREILGKPKKLKDFNNAIHEIESEIGLLLGSQNTPNITNQQKPDNCTSNQYTPRSETRSVNQIPNISIDEGIQNGEINILCKKESNSFNAGLPQNNNEVLTQRQDTIINNQIEILSCLRLELQLIEIDIGIRTSLSLEKADTDTCMKYLDDLNALNIKPLMLKKHPEVIQMLVKLQNYVGNISNWSMSEEEAKDFHSKARIIRLKAKEVYNKIQSKFFIPYGKTFAIFFQEKLNEFNVCTKHMTPGEINALTHDPTENGGLSN